MSGSPLYVSEHKQASPARRRYSQDFKRQVVETSFRPGVSAAQVARQHGLNGNLLHTWRWHYRRGLLGVVKEGVALPPSDGLIPVHLSTDAPAEGVAGGAEHRLTIRCGDCHIALQGELDPTIVQMVLTALVR